MARSRLTIRKCLADSGGIRMTKEAFEVMVNPVGVSVGDATTFSDATDLSGEVSHGATKRRSLRTLTVDKLVLDGTGILTGGKAVEVKELVAQLRAVAYTVSEKRLPPVVNLEWGGSLGFYRVNKLDVKYTLFRPDGSPLRAEVTMAFETYREPKPGKASATPPLGEDCFEVAKARQLTSFRAGGR